MSDNFAIPTLILSSAAGNSEAAAPSSARPHSKFIYQILAAKLSADPELQPSLQKIGDALGSGENLNRAIRALEPEKRQALQSRIGWQFLEELASLDRERDSELFWSGALHAVERQESRRRDGQLPSILGAWLANPELSPELRQLLERKLEESQGRGTFGARAEYFISHFHRQAFDAKTLAPMLAAGLLGKMVQTAALGRLTAVAPAWWSRGPLARSAALSAGFGSEVAVLGAAHGEIGRSALSLASMKVGLWGGGKASLPIPLALVGATTLGLKAEEQLGWRAPSSLNDALADAGASALSFGWG